MKKWPNIFKFLLIFLIAYLGLTGLTFISPVRKAAVSVYNEAQQVAFNIFHPTIRTNFKTYDGPAPDEYDYAIHIHTKANWNNARSRKNLKPTIISNQNARLTAFGPFIMLIALIIGSPVNWKKKLFSFFIGSFIICILLSLKYTALFYEGTDNDQLRAMFHPKGSSLWISISNFFNDAFRTHEFLALLIIPIWAITSMNRKDWVWFLK